MNSSQESLDDVLNALSVSNIPNVPTKPIKPRVKEYIEDDILQETLEMVDELIASNSDILEENKRLVESTGDVEYFETYASISKSQAEAVKMKLKLITDKEKNKDFRETKNKEIDVKEKLVNFQIGELEHKRNALPSGATLNQTNVIMSGSREEALEFIKKMQMIEQEKKDEEVGKVVEI
jgi:hypothetical protein